MYRNYFKRFIDIILSIFLLITLSPLLLIVALVIRILMGNPVIFKQERIGLKEKKFYICKFRTMADTRDSHGIYLPDSERITVLGKFLRKTSIDELPELFNILKGEMSFVGPRPLLVEYLPYYTKEERCRHSIRPGLTGLAQVNGRNNLNWDIRLKIDEEYVSSFSLCLDIKIMFCTLINLIKMKDINVIPSESGNKLSVNRSNL